MEFSQKQFEALRTQNERLKKVLNRAYWLLHGCEYVKQPDGAKLSAADTVEMIEQAMKDDVIRHPRKINKYNDCRWFKEEENIHTFTE